NSSPGELGTIRRDVVGHIFQELNLIPTLTAYENVELPMLATKAPGSARKKRTEELLTAMGLEDRMKHKPDELSGGQRQRVAIAAALANNPEVLLCDEPTGDLDSATGDIIVQYLNMVNKEFGKTVLMVTDGQIISIQSPTADEETSATSRVEIVRERLAEIKDEIVKLDERAKAGDIELGVFAGRRTKLSDKLKVFEEELHRLGL
ncbi:MAG: ABC transporter ATP-binding protein, partial [Candidatus Thorarchaeota archaeon]